VPAIYGVVAAAEVERLTPELSSGAAQSEVGSGGVEGLAECLAPQTFLRRSARRCAHELLEVLEAQLQRATLPLIEQLVCPHHLQMDSLALTAAKMSQAAAELVARERECLYMK